MGERMTKELVIQALKQANGRCDNPKGVLIHSYRGSQYCSNDYQKEVMIALVSSSCISIIITPIRV